MAGFKEYHVQETQQGFLDISRHAGVFQDREISQFGQ